MIDADKYSRLAKLQPSSMWHRGIWNSPNYNSAVRRSRFGILSAMPNRKLICTHAI